MTPQDAHTAPVSDAGHETAPTHVPFRQRLAAALATDYLLDAAEQVCEDEMRLRSQALNRTAEDNDRMRGRLARVEAAVRLVTPDEITPQGARIIRAALGGPR